MTRKKPSVVITDATGSVLKDRRFEPGHWPIQLEVPPPQAETWFTYLAAECRARGWPCTQLSQLEARENSGSFTITVDGSTKLVTAWERKRGKSLKLKSRVDPPASSSTREAEEFLNVVTAKCWAATLRQIYCRGLLEYDGMPWCGELWLDDSLRLGPPSKQYDQALLGPRIVVVDAILDAVDDIAGHAAFEVKLREVSVFLSVIAAIQVKPASQSKPVWTWAVAADGPTSCDVRQSGYLEAQPSGMPPPESVRAVPLREVERPDFGPGGISIDDNEQWAPADIADLWHRYKNLSDELRNQFLQAGNLWQCSQTLGHDYATTRFALMVASGEALKPAVSDSRGHKLYHVVGGLLGAQAASVLTQDWFKAQEARSVHLHAGEFRGGEFKAQEWMSSFVDPSFDRATRSLFVIVKAAFVEWLARGGRFTPLALKRPSKLRRWTKHYAPITLAVIVGLTLGWLLRGK